jgi:hypothetical protein
VTGSDQALAELVCITGMHRSGTSLLARVVNLLGVSLGDEAALMGPGPDNPSGYWENRWVKELDDELLAHLGGAWDQPPLLTGDWALDPSLDPFRDRAADILSRDYAGEGRCHERPAGCKEPRFCLLHPFWRTVVPISATVVVVREPSQVAASLARRNGMDPAQGAALWLRYLFAATTEPALVLSLDELTDDPEPTARRLAGHLGLPEPEGDVLDRVRAHHDPSILHRRPATPAEDLRSPNMELATAVWNGGEPALEILAPAVRTALAEGWLGPPANRAAIDRARAENVQLNEKLRKWHRKRKAQKLKHPGALLPPLPGDESGEP